MRRLFGAATVAAVMVALAVSGVTQGASARSTPIGVLVQTDRHAVLPRAGGTVDSLNWSGYAVTPPGRDVTGVSSSFVVPAAGLVPPGFAGTWTGIGGFGTTDLIQAGTSEQSLPSLPVIGPQYYAWYELLPQSETPLTGCRGDPTCAVTRANRSRSPSTRSRPMGGGSP